MHDLIFVSLENWDDVWRRNQFICAELSRRHPDQKILFVGLPHNISHSLRRGQLTQVRADTPQPLTDFPNIFTFHPTKWWPNTLLWGRKTNELAFRRQVRCAAYQLGITKPLLWINAHSAGHMSGRMNEFASVYDITDDWISFNHMPALKKLTTNQDRHLCHHADATIVCSQRLFDMKKPLCRYLFLVPNGVDLQHYSYVADGTCAIDTSAQTWKHPVLGYMGTIHSERVDISLVEKLAQTFTKGTLALVGPNLLTETEQRRLSTYKNVVLTGAVAYEKVPQFLAAFDVCLVPHLESEFTESLNPIKLWEYLATGKPIVSTNVAGFRDFVALCQVVSGSGAFINACKTALTCTDSLSSERIQVAAANNWKARVDEIENIFAFVAKEQRVNL